MYNATKAASGETGRNRRLVGMDNLGYPRSAAGRGPSIVSGNIATRDLVSPDRRRMLQSPAGMSGITNLPMPGVRPMLPAMTSPMIPDAGFAQLPMPNRPMLSPEEVNRARALAAYFDSLGIR